jgi:HCOMODA/2-hydroxy-3-carboxy-muconic semialdehyde decarboxylase
MLIRTPELGRALAESVGQSTVVLIRGHGNVVMGQSLRQTVFRAVYTEINARVQIQAQALALAGCEVRYLNTAEAAAADATNGKAVGRSWDLWVRRWFTEQ